MFRNCHFSLDRHAILPRVTLRPVCTEGAWSRPQHVRQAILEAEHLPCSRRVLRPRSASRGRFRLRTLGDADTPVAVQVPGPGRHGASTASTLRRKRPDPTKTVATSTHFDLLMVVWQDVRPGVALWVLS